MDRVPILYVELLFDEATQTRLSGFQKSIGRYLGTDKLVYSNPSTFHITVQHSNVVVPYIIEDVKGKVLDVVLKPSIWSVNGGEEDIVVLELESDFVQNRHLYGRHIGTSYDYSEYRPHITIITELMDTKKKKLVESLTFKCKLVLSKERMEVAYKD